MAASKNFKCQYLPYSLADLNKIHTKVFALIRSLLLNVLLLTIAFSFKEVTFLESTIIIIKHYYMIHPCVRTIITRLQLVAYRLVHTDEPYNKCYVESIELYVLTKISTQNFY